MGFFDWLRDFLQPSTFNDFPPITPNATGYSAGRTTLRSYVPGGFMGSTSAGSTTTSGPSKDLSDIGALLSSEEAAKRTRLDTLRRRSVELGTTRPLESEALRPAFALATMQRAEAESAYPAIKAGVLSAAKAVDRAYLGTHVSSVGSTVVTTASGMLSGSTPNMFFNEVELEKGLVNKKFLIAGGAAIVALYLLK